MPIKAAKYDKKKPSDLYTKVDRTSGQKPIWSKVLRIYTRKKDDADGWS